MCVPGSVLVPAEPGDHAVGGALVLDLEHRPLAGLVDAVESLGHDAIEAGTLEPVEPVRRRRAIQRRRRQVDRRRRATEHGLQPRPSLAQRRVAQVLVADGQQVPGDERRGARLGQHLHPRRGRVDAEEQRLEVEHAVVRDDDLAVQDASLGQRGTQRIGQFGEVAVERLQVARLRVDLVAVTEDDRPEAVPLRLEQPAVVGRQAVGRLGEHGFQGRVERQVEGHRPSVPASAQGLECLPRPLAAQVPARPAGVGRVGRELLGALVQEPGDGAPGRPPGDAAGRPRRPGWRRRAARTGSRDRGPPGHRAERATDR